MALDTKQKRGSAMLISKPYRPWLSNPSGTASAGHRLSLLRMFAGSSGSPVAAAGIRGCVHIDDCSVTTVTINDEAC